MVKKRPNQRRKRPNNNKVKIRGNQWIKGKRGNAAQFITRTMAIRKLQITLQEFRKLCILKGIYPRKPSRAPKGNDKTYYLKKDIAFIAADPITKKLAERRA
jgi:pescadillo protein